MEENPFGAVLGPLILLAIGILLFCLSKSLSNGAKKIRENRNVRVQKTLDELTNQGINITHTFFKKIYFDDDSKKIALDDDDRTVSIYNYSDILNYEIETNSYTKTTQGDGVSRAVVGGMLFGGTGAIVGATTATPATSSEFTVYIITIYFKDGTSDGFRISPHELMSIYYPKIFNLDEQVEELQAVLQDIANKYFPKLETKPETSNLSSADEIVKFKKLYDDGVITFEEYEEKNNSF